MTILLKTNLALSEQRSEQCKQALPILFKLNDQEIKGLYFYGNKKGNLVVCIEDDNYESMAMLHKMRTDAPAALAGFNDYFSGLECEVTSFKEYAFIPKKYNAISFVDAIKENLESPESQMNFQMVTRRHENSVEREEMASKINSRDSSHDPLAQYHADLQRGQGMSDFGVGASRNSIDDDIDPWAKKTRKKKHYCEYEAKAVAFYKALSTDDNEAVAAIYGDAFPEIDAISAPDTTAKTDINDENETAVTLRLSPRTRQATTLAESDSSAIAKELRDRLGFGIGYEIQYQRNALGNVTTFDITFKGLNIKKADFAHFKRDVKAVLYATATEADYEFSDLSVKRTIVASNTKRLAKLTASFFASRRETGTMTWKNHTTPNVKYTLFASTQANTADALQKHLETGGLHCYKRNKTNTGKEAISVDLTRRGTR